MKKEKSVSSKYKLSKKQLQNLYTNFIDNSLSNDVDIFSDDNREDIEMLLSFVACIIKHNLMLKNENNKELYIEVCKTFPVAKISILLSSNVPLLQEILTTEEVQHDYLIQYRNDVNFQQKLKILNVKDLRQIAITIGIDIFARDNNNKLYTKVELRQHIETKLQYQ